MDLYNELHDLCNMVEDDLQDVNRKLKNSGKMSDGDLSYVDKLTHVLKSIKTTMAMMDAEGGSNAYMGRSSYARRRDSMGRYTRADGRMMDRSYDNAYDSGMMAELRELMEDAPDEKTRQKFQRFINELGH